MRGTEDISMDPAEILAEIQSLRAQLNALEAKVRESLPRPTHTFGDLYGLLKGQVESTKEDIDAVLYREPHEPEL
jgi:hypothetical protein